jgi:hypothetical protein
MELQLQRRGGGAFEKNMMQRLENTLRQPQGNGQKKKNNKRKANNPPRNPPAPKRQKNNNGLSTARPQKAAAAAYSSGQHTGEAKIFRNGKDSCRIVHRELLSSITGSVAFTIPLEVALNPGLNVSFPWLSTQAQAWERYRFNRLRFCYFTRTGSNIPGSLMLAPDYDAADDPPISESIASSYEDCEEDAPWKDICCVLPQRSLMGDMKEKFIRSGPLQPNQDIKTYDAGNLFVCTVDGTAVGWGKLWVEYDITLYNPQTPAGGFMSSGTLDGGSGLATGALFGTAATQLAKGPISITTLDASPNTLRLANLQIGQEIFASLTFTGTVITAAPAAVLTGLTVISTLGNVFNAAQTSAVLNQTYRVTAVNATIAVTLPATTLTASQVVVSSLVPSPTF